MKADKANPLRNGLAGAGSGLIAAILVCPLDVVKVRLQNQTVIPGVPPLYRGTFPTLAKVWRMEGLRGLFSGLSPTVIAYIPDRAIWFSVYQAGKEHLPRILGVNDSTGLYLLATLIASVSSTVMTTPIWVVRTRMMTQNADSRHYTSVGGALATIVREEGWGALYKGLGPSLLGVSHSLVMFPLYEKLKHLIQDYERSFPGKQDAQISTAGILVASAASKCVASLATYPHEVLRTRLQTQRTRTHLPVRTGWENPTPSSAAGGAGSSRSRVAPRPMQPSAPKGPKYVGIIQTTRTIIAEEGLASLYQGLSTSLIRQVPAGAISLWVYEILIKSL